MFVEMFVKINFRNLKHFVTQGAQTHCYRFNSTSDTIKYAYYYLFTSLILPYLNGFNEIIEPFYYIWHYDMIVLNMCRIL